MAKKHDDENESYEDILNRSYDDLPDAAVLPDGRYRVTARNAAYMPAQEEGKNDRVIIFYVAKEPLDDVDLDALKALGPDVDETLENAELSYQIFIEKTTDWKKKVFPHLRLLGIDVESMTPKQALDAVKKAHGEVVAYIGQRTFTGRDGVQTVNTMSQFEAVE